MEHVIRKLQAATAGTVYEGRLFLVGGCVRDQLLGLPLADDLDIVLEGDALELARFLSARGIGDHRPVLYPRFGTAMISVEGQGVELVSARAESYESSSRKPRVERATLRDDVMRRDFTINTLLQNLHTGEILDLTGRGIRDIKAGLIRTPLLPAVTFHDDPLRMLRAIRFAVRFGFAIEEETWRGIVSEAGRINLLGPEPPVVSAERVRDEFVKILMTDRSYRSAPSTPPVRGLEMMREAGLLSQFAPELMEMPGVTQNRWHLYDVWTHTMAALEKLPAGAPLEVRLALLLHDAGKRRTRSEDERGIHFYDHPSVGAEMARELLRRLRFTTDQIRKVSALVQLHMRLGEARPEWSDAAIRRLIRAIAPYREELFEMARCDIAAMNPEAPTVDLAALRRRMEELERQADIANLGSPLDGREIMEVLGISPGPLVREAKEHLTNEVIEGRLPPNDASRARESLLKWWRKRSNPVG